MRISSNSSNTAGFTLIEVLIALAIVAIALMALVKASSYDVNAADHLKQKNIAAWVAMTINTQLQTGQLAIQSQQGTQNMFQQNWYWTVQRTQTPDPGIDKLTISVSNTADGVTLFNLESFFVVRS